MSSRDAVLRAAPHDEVGLHQEEVFTIEPSRLDSRAVLS